MNKLAWYLLKNTNKDQSQSTVTLSWYKIDCEQSELITDLLKASSGLQPSGVAAPRVGETGLVLRELGRGRGMQVPGLWEVELGAPGDINEIISHVQRVLPTAHHNGSGHTVFQFTVCPQPSKRNAAHTSAVSIFSL